MRPVTIKPCCFLLTSCLLLGACAELNTGNPANRGFIGTLPGSGPQVSASVKVSIGQREARQLAISHGLTGMGGLPPGIQRKLARGKPLPPGIARKMVPRGMLVELPGIPNHEWRIAGRDLILVVAGTLIVVDILNDVFA